MISIPDHNFQQEDPREEKLPKWAQDQIETMRRRIAELARQNHELREGNPKSPFSIRTMDRGENDRFGIGPAHMGWIEFSVDDEHRLRLAEKDGWLDVSVHAKAQTALVRQGVTFGWRLSSRHPRTYKGP